MCKLNDFMRLMFKNMDCAWIVKDNCYHDQEIRSCEMLSSAKKAQNIQKLLTTLGKESGQRWLRNQD